MPAWAGVTAWRVALQGRVRDELCSGGSVAVGQWRWANCRGHTGALRLVSCVKSLGEAVSGGVHLARDGVAVCGFDAHATSDRCGLHRCGSHGLQGATCAPPPFLTAHY